MIGLIQKVLTKKVKAQTHHQSLELHDIQGIVLFSYKHLPHSSYLFLRIDHPEAAKRWLENCLKNQQITSAQWSQNSPDHPEKKQVIKPKTAMNIALTYAGLEALGGSDTLKASFPSEFQQGMQHPERSRRIGDFEGTINHPSQWDSYWQDDQVHLLVMLQAEGQEMQNLEQQFNWSNYGLTLLETERGYLPADHREHFGFRDAISQPTVNGSPQALKAPAPDPQLTQAGEFVLGYLNEDGNYPQTPFVHLSEDPINCLPPLSDRHKRDFGRNGSYLVYRKMEQDVAGFRRYFHEEFDTPEEGQKMAAKAVGRWPSGVSLIESPEADPGCPNDQHPRNDFNYRTVDPRGSRCPFSSHIRRTNPRDSHGDNAVDAHKAAQRRRILRRGTVYGDPLPAGQLESDQQSRGLHFFCLNTSIRRQFEFIQQSWINNPKFHGLYEERDPLVGMNPDGSNRPMTVPDHCGAKQLSMPNFVAVKGGAYFFVPSLSALEYLSRL